MQCPGLTGGVAVPARRGGGRTRIGRRRSGTRTTRRRRRRRRTKTARARESAEPASDLSCFVLDPW
eukprot:3522339-Rhodomonas_salina.3